MKDDLDSLLKTWKPEVPEPVAFKRHVWSRIELRRFAIGWPERFLAWFTRPQIASLAAALSVLGGAWIGSATAARNGQVTYLHAVNPYAQVPLK